MRAALALGVLLLALVACEASTPPAKEGPIAGWPAWGGDPGGTRFSPLTQITRENVDRLQVAWTFRTGDLPDATRAITKGAFEATPILLGDALYLCTPRDHVFALDAETGAPRWSFDPEVDTEGVWNPTCRGVATWEDPAPKTEGCRRRIFLGTIDARLFALDAATGRPCPDFGAAGSVDLRAGIGEIRPGEYGVTSAPAVVRDVVAVGALVADGDRTDHPGGVVRGFDARTGALRWAWDPVPPGTAPLSPDPGNGAPRFHRGTPNAWAPFAVDPVRDLLFVPTGNAGPDFYGGRRNGLDHFSSSLVALRGSTGERVWHFQTVHHDLWDFDVASQPVLSEVARDGRTIAAVIQATKMGHIFVLNRETGEPLWPVEERPVPAGDVPGERYAPTQPFPTHPRPLHPSRLHPDDAWGLVPWHRAACRRRIAELRSEGIFTPPTLRGSIQYPGPPGGANWGSLAIDGERGLFVLNQMRLPFAQTVLPRERVASWAPRPPFDLVFEQAGTPYAHLTQPLVVPDSLLPIPCVAPPWGTLVAVDLASGEKRWEVPFGTTRGLVPFAPFGVELGLPSLGGPIATASGLVFIAAALDQYLRAYDLETGEELWRTRLPAGGQATPMTYRLRPEGRQYVVIAAGGHATLGTRLGDFVMAFALP